MIAARVGVAFSGEERVFGGDYEVVPIGFQEFAEEALAPALVVFVGGKMSPKTRIRVELAKNGAVLAPQRATL